MKVIISLIFMLSMNSFSQRDSAFKYKSYGFDDVITVVEFSQSLERLKNPAGAVESLKRSIEEDFCVEATSDLSLSELTEMTEELNKKLRKVGLKTEVLDFYEASREQGIANLSITGINKRGFFTELKLNICE